MPQLRIPVAFCCDRNVVDGLFATMASAAFHLRAESSLDVFVIDAGLGADMREKVAASARRLPRTTLTFVEFDTRLLDTFPTSDFLLHCSKAAYARLLLHELLPELKEVIYLDCDLLVQLDLTDLYQHFPLTRPLAAVRDSIVPTLGHPMETLRDSFPTLPTDAPYFNSGVLLLDLAKLREMKAMERYKDCVAQFRPKMVDQSVLNVVFAQSWQALPARWNRMTNLSPNFNCFATERGIWHFCYKCKPWLFVEAGGRGLLKEWNDVIRKAGWSRVAQPTLRVTASRARDAIKSVRAALHRYRHAA